MYSVSDDFKTAVYAPARTSKARITFDISDPTASGDVSSITSTAQATISDESQLINKAREQSYNLATCEPDRFKLDGSFIFADDTLANNKEMGFASDILSGVDGSFSPFPTITFQFGGNHSSVGITVTFDPLNGEYATEFNISAYNSSDVLIDSVDVENNDKPQYAAINPINDYRKIVVTVKKWCKADRRARVVEVDFGIVRMYTGDNLIKCSLIEELDLTTSSLPSVEFKFAVDNLDREFNILNPSGFYQYLQQRQTILAELGIKAGTIVEYVLLGSYLLFDWASDEGSLTASFTARTNLDTMSEVDYENLVAKSSYSLNDMAVDMFALCGITNYQIDVGLQSILTNALVKKTDCKSILQMIALAGCANIYITRDNIIVLKISPSSLGTEVVDTIDMDNMYQEAKIELEKITKTVEVAYHADLSNSAIIAVNNPGINSGEVLKLESNTLINTSARATAVADWLLLQKSYRAKYDVNWRGNPAHELNDIITIENTYGDSKKAVITKNSIEYQGYLSAKTEARGLTDVG